MKKILVFVLLICAVSLTAQSHSLMPVPVKYNFNDSKLRITDSLYISVKGNPDQRIYKYATNTLRRIDQRTAQFFIQEHVIDNSSFEGDIIIDIMRPGKNILGEDESYSLVINDKKALVKAETDLGAIHALETLLQLIESDEKGYYFRGAEIEDLPRFKWRGLMMDVCRHYIPMDVVLRNIDAMSMFKMNVLHLHITEDQGFRIESKTFPYLHEFGSDGNYYTHADIKKIIKYANDRGIRVVPEFDIPGHATSWFVGKDDLASLPGPYTIERKWGIFDPTFDPSKEETYEFFDAFFKEMAELFNDEYMHIGGDENNGKQWKANESIQAFMRKNSIEDKNQLQAYFNKRISDILTKYNKKMVGWDEIQHPDLPNDIVIHSWRGKDGIRSAVENGYQTMLSNGWYIDLMQSTKDQYLNDPLPKDLDEIPASKDLVLGGEATIWSEFVTPENIDSRIWPRTIAIAERLWSKREVNDFDEMLPRLEVNSLRLEEVGSKHLTYYDMILRRLVRSENISALKNFVNLVEPLKEYDRLSDFTKVYKKNFTSYYPYTRVMDAAKPDPMCAIKFGNLVAEFIKNKNEADFKKLKNILSGWIDNDVELQNVIDKNPILHEIRPMAKNLKSVSIVGLDIISKIMNKDTADNSWLSDAEKVIKTAYEKHGQVNLMIVPSVEKLLKEVNIK